MQVKIMTDKTIGGIKNAIENAMNKSENKRKREFVCVANKEGYGIVHSQNEVGAYSAEYKGYQGVGKSHWKNVPNYADKVAEKLFAIMTAE